jgi:hypothetical protein
MSNTTLASKPKKSAYQRPYKTRSERRKIARDKHGEVGDYKFLKRVGLGVGLLILVVLAFAFKGMLDREKAMPPGSRPVVIDAVN